MKKKVIIESHIPLVPDSIGDNIEIVRLAPAQIDNNALHDVSGMIVRTRTRVDGSLLHNTPVEFVATATIGTDHLDNDYLAGRDIETVSAPGCNAPAVAQYVYASLLAHPTIAQRNDTPLKGLTIAVVGVGNVGSIVSRWGRQLGMNVIAVDPPRAERGDTDDGHPFISLEQALSQADIITLHTPLTAVGKHPTAGMIDHRAISLMRPGAVIINAARGGIVDETALCDAVESERLAPPIIDCWVNEPQISDRLLAVAAVATPHIAGYSSQGKARATRVTVDALCRHFGLPQYSWPSLDDPLGKGAKTVTTRAISQSYDPTVDTTALRANPAAFESLRNNYNLRDEVV